MCFVDEFGVVGGFVVELVGVIGVVDVVVWEVCGLVVEGVVGVEFDVGEV